MFNKMYDIRLQFIEAGTMYPKGTPLPTLNQLYISATKWRLNNVQTVVLQPINVVLRLLQWRVPVLYLNSLIS